eukprot:GHVS01007352.1.p1 GENE.GHVS01007352.1~~GHVS01007352.1.p1  ORF type:complete len:293 (-),score=17.17 GHVS01007352.1:417-1295(-)
MAMSSCIQSVVMPTCAYLRSGFTPAVFKSSKLGATRVPCYFILCLLLLDAIPQTRNVAMGFLLDGPRPPAEEETQYHRQTRKLVHPYDEQRQDVYGGGRSVITMTEHGFAMKDQPETSLAGKIKLEMFERECKPKIGRFVENFRANVALAAIDSSKDATYKAAADAWSVALQLNVTLVLTSHDIDGQRYIATLTSAVDFIEDETGDIEVMYCQAKRQVLTADDLSYIQKSFEPLTISKALYGIIIVSLFIALWIIPWLSFLLLLLFLKLYKLGGMKRILCPAGSKPWQKKND